LEATIVSSDPGRPVTNAGTAQIFDWIDHAFHPDFFVAVNVHATGTETPRRRQIEAPLIDWLDSLDWASLRYRMETNRRFDFPETTIEVRGWILEFSAIPKSSEARGDRRMRTIGIYPGSAAWGGALADSIRAKVVEKANRYGPLDAPLIVAVRVLSGFASPGEVPQGLFGFEPPLWGPHGRSANRASAVLAATEFGYPTVARNMPELWINPWADHEIAADLPWAMHVTSNDGSARKHQPARISPREFFELPRDWPGEPFAQRRRRRAADKDE